MQQLSVRKKEQYVSPTLRCLYSVADHCNGVIPTAPLCSGRKTPTAVDAPSTQHASPPQGVFVRWLKLNFSEVFVTWIHVKALRVFVESALRLATLPHFSSPTLRVCVCEHRGRLSGQVRIAAQLSGSPAADGREAFKEAGGAAVPAFHAPGPHGGRLQDGRKKPNQSSKVLEIVHVGSCEVKLLTRYSNGTWQVGFGI